MSDSHGKKWRVPLEEVAGQISGTLHDPPDFKAVELHANIKRGTEVVLGGVASMPDTLEKIREMRLLQFDIIRKEKLIVELLQVAPEILDGDSEEFEAEARRTLDGFHRDFKETRIQLSSYMVGSLVNHVLLETSAVDGKAREQGVEEVKALVLHEENQFEKMFPERKHRSLLHPLGEKK